MLCDRWVQECASGRPSWGNILHRNRKDEEPAPTCFQAAAEVCPAYVEELSVILAVNSPEKTGGKAKRMLKAVVERTKEVVFRVVGGVCRKVRNAVSRAVNAWKAQMNGKRGSHSSIPPGKVLGRVRRLRGSRETNGSTGSSSTTTTSSASGTSDSRSNSHNPNSGKAPARSLITRFPSQGTKQDRILAAQRVLAAIQPGPFEVAFGLNSLVWTVMGLGFYVRKRGLLSRTVRASTAGRQPRGGSTRRNNNGGTPEVIRRAAQVRSI